MRLRVGDRVIGEALASLPRPDVAERFKIGGDHGFRLPFTLLPEDAGHLVVEARAAPDAPWLSIRNLPAQRKSQYQSFDDAPGASRSAEKLDALRLSLLPNSRDKSEPLKGLSVLDIGCNEGFFCGEALRQGARRVLGIEASDTFVARARARFPAAEFRHGSWWKIPEEKFDVILFLSAIHYEEDPAALLRKLTDHLTPAGTLVVECGIVAGRGKAWRSVTRTDGERRYPTLDMFVDEVCQPFVARLVGQSVPQSGDPVRRLVFHCVQRESIALIVVGRSCDGKSTLAREFGQQGMPVLSTDRLLMSILNEKRFDGRVVAERARRFLPPPISFNHVGDALAAERPAEFVEVLLDELPAEASTICIEGEILRHRSVSDLLVRGLRARNIRPWIVAAQKPSVTRALASRGAAAFRGALVAGRIAAVRAMRRIRAR